jgi:hypothetical protein
MSRDPIMKEVRRIKEEIAAKFNYDAHALGEHLREVQRKSGLKVVKKRRKKDPPR